MSSSKLMDLINSKKEQLKSQRSRLATLKPKLGRNRYHLLPTWRDPKISQQFWHDFGQHFIKGPDGLTKAVYVCSDKSFAKACPLCTLISAAKKQVAGDETMTKLLHDGYATHRVLLNVLEVEGNDPKMPQVLEIGPSVFEQVLNLIMEWGEDAILGLDNSRDIIIERTGVGLTTKYAVQVSSSTVTINKNVMKNIVNLDEYVSQENDVQKQRAINSLYEISGIRRQETDTATTTVLPSLTENLPVTVAAENEKADAGGHQEVKEMFSWKEGMADDMLALADDGKTVSITDSDLEAFLADLK